MFIPRDSAKILKNLAKGFPVVAVTGPRQSGKSTLVRNVFEYKPYVNLEDLELRAYATEDPKRFLAQYPDGAILDEAQRAPDLFSYIQLIVDDMNKMGMFILTGSQQFGLMAKITQSLAGRIATLNLLPFSLNELQNSDKLSNSLDEIIFKGLYPPIYDRDLEPSIWLANYMQSYIERDIRQMIQIRDLSTFQRFLKMCAARTGQLLNLSSLANDCGISHNTANAWISILEASFIVYLLKPYHRNFNKRLIKTPKLYFLDSGLVCYLLGIKTAGQLNMHINRGALFETMIVSEILKAGYNSAQNPGLFFWRDRTGNEIDLIIENGNYLDPVEIKSGHTVINDYFRMLKKWPDIA
jgi:predicted AAA+ superfamily ATPase